MTTTIHLDGDDDMRLLEALSTQWHSGIIAEFATMLRDGLRGRGDTEPLDADDREYVAGINAAKAEQRVRELQESNQAVLLANRDLRGECEMLHGQIKIMTEDRDHYQQQWQAATDYNSEPILVMQGATADEQALVAAFYSKLMGEGRREHGPLDLVSDDRDLLGEAADELGDTIAYLLMEQRRLAVRRRVS